MNKWVEILLGLILVLLPVNLAILNVANLGLTALEFLKGGLMWFIFFLGILFLMLGISDLKEK